MQVHYNARSVMYREHDMFNVGQFTIQRSGHASKGTGDLQTRASYLLGRIKIPLRIRIWT